MLDAGRPASADARASPLRGSEEQIMNEPADTPSTRQEELRSFLFFTVVMAPVAAVAIVVGFGFLVWMYQLIAGPPGSS